MEFGISKEERTVDRRGITDYIIGTVKNENIEKIKFSRFLRYQACLG